VGKMLDCFHIENHLFDHWGEISPKNNSPNRRSKE
jgi:hypothetical protein